MAEKIALGLVREKKAVLEKKKHKGVFKKDSMEYAIMCAPAMLLVFVFCYLPIFGIILAFKQYNIGKGILGSDWVGLKNFQFFFSSQDATRVTVNTLYNNFLFILCGTVFALILAFFLYEVSSKLMLKLYNSFMIMPNFISWVVVGYMSYALLSPTMGIVNKALQNMGFDVMDWYQRPKMWPGILTAFYVWKTAGVNCIIYYAGLVGIDRAFYEAALVDGANKWQITFRIVLPFIIPLISIMVLLQVGGIFRADFGMFYNLTRDAGALYSTTDVIDTYIFRTLRVQGDIGTSSAVGLFQSVVGFTLVMLTNWVVKKNNEDAALI